jgi:hypothetical protein
MKDWYKVEGGKKPFGGFSRQRFNGFIVNNWLNFANGKLED